MTAPAPERLAELLAAVEMATEADFYIDLEILKCFAIVHGAYWSWPNEDHAEALRDAPPFTSSVDAALALVERVLPGLGIVMCRLSGSGLIQVREAFVFDEETDMEIEPEEHWRPRPPALAIVACLLRALISGAHHAD